MSNIQQEEFGKMPHGVIIRRYTLQNSNGLIAKLIDYGAILTELWTPDRDGNSADVVCGFANLDQYLQGHPYFGATTGRYANRIARGRFSLDGAEYTLATNNGPNHLHGGLKGFDKQVWTSEPLADQPGRQSVRFNYSSRDGEEGYPGNLSVTVIYTLTDKDELVIDYTASTDKPTIVNLTNHSYFNLSGSGDILDHELMIAASNYTPVDDRLIPTGQIAPVKGTPFDFTRPARIGERFDQLENDPIGYDHNFVLNDQARSPGLAARATDPKSGRTLEVRTTEPGLQFYTGNFLNGTLRGVNGVTYKKNSAFCLETQHFPDSPNQPNFPSTTLRPGQTYRSTTIYAFGK